MKAYHISYPSNRQSILENGLLPKNSKKYAYLDYEPRTFFFIPKAHQDVLVAFYHTRDEDMDIWEIDIDVEELNKDIKSESENHFWIDRPIQANLYRANINMWDVVEGYFL